MDKVTIEILDSENSIEGVLEIGSTKYFNPSLTTSIADLKDISTRSGSFSTSFKIPSIADNDNLLEHIYLSYNKNYKDLDAEKDCRVRVNDITIETGRLQITRIGREGRDLNSYSAKFFGNNMDWVLKMKGKTMQDLPYLDTTITYDNTEIENSWSRIGGSEQPVFSLINRGQKAITGEFNVLDLRPDYFVLDVLNNAFKSVGYNFESTHFNSSEQKQLMLTFFGKNFRDDERGEANKAIVMLDSSVTNLDTSFSVSTGENYLIDIGYPVGFWYNPALNQLKNHQANTFTYGTLGGIRTIATSTKVADYDDSPAPLRDDSGNFTSNIYTVPYTNKYKVFFTADFTYTQDSSLWYSNAVSIYHQLRVTSGGVVRIYPLNSVGGGSLTSTTNGNFISDRYVRNLESSWNKFQAGDTIEIVYTLKAYRSGANPSATDYYAKLTHAAVPITFQPLELFDEGDDFSWKTVSDDVVSLLDIVTDIGKIFNIYWRTNTATKTVYAEPRDDFYDDLINATNETDRIISTNQFEINYNSSFYNKTHKFAFKEDDKDGFLKARNEEATSDWCSYEHSYPSKFKEGTTKLETKALSATYTLEDVYCGGDIPPILARLWVDETNLKSIYESEVLAPRLLYYNYSTQQDIDGNSRNFQWRTEATKRTTIPYALPFPVIDEGVTLADVDGEITFKEVDSNDGLWNRYFKKTASEIVDGKRLKLHLKTDLIDYKNIDFRKIYYFDNRYPEVEGYWRLIKVSGFKPVGEEVGCAYEFTQARNFDLEPYTVGEEVEQGLEGTTMFRYIPPNAGINSDDSISAGRGTINMGYNNTVKDASNMVLGNDLTNGGEASMRMGVNNLDVSTDLFQLGVGSDFNPYSLIRLTEGGDMYFNGQLIQPDTGFKGGIAIDVSTDTTLTGVESVVYCDSSAGTFTITLPSSPVDDWNIRIIDSVGSCGANKVTIDGNGYNINGSATGNLISDYEDWDMIFNGTQYNI